MKKGKNNHHEKTRLICYNPTSTNGNNYYLCKWNAQNKLWERNGGGKSIRNLLPLIDGNKYRFVISQETKEKLLEVSASKKFSSLVGKLFLID